jgi:hypothetical protein
MALSFALVACSDDDPSGPNGSADGHASATAIADPRSEQGTADVTSPGGSPRFHVAGSAFSGSMTPVATASIYNTTGTWAAVGSTSAGTLQMQGTGELVVDSDATVDAGTYQAVRLTLDNAALTVDAGSTIGGIVLEVDVALDVGGGDQSVQIEKQVSFDVEASADARSAVFFDLNAESWVNESTVDAETVTDAEIESAVTAFAAAEVR